MKRYSEIEKKIYSLLTQSTGSHFLDSGGAYGRHWERNKKKTISDFHKEKEVSWNGDYYSISIFRLLTQRLSLDETCRQFNEINENADNADSEVAYGLSLEGENLLKSLNAEIGKAWNTYNWESNLSQVLQGSNVTINGKEYVLLQIHNGCDVRGGYTTACLFVNNAGNYLLWESVYGYVKIGKKYISVDNGYNGHSLTDENNAEVEIPKNAKVELQLSEI